MKSQQISKEILDTIAAANRAITPLTEEERNRICLMEIAYQLAVMNERSVIVSEVTDWPDEDTTHANALLLAVAPDLLAACDEFHALLWHYDLVRQPNGVDWGDEDELRRGWIERLEALLGKARGE